MISAGSSVTPLDRKLGLKPGQRILVPEGATVLGRAGDDRDVVVTVRKEAR